MRLTIAHSKIKKRNLVLINNATYQRETLSKRPIRQPLIYFTKRNQLKKYHNFILVGNVKMNIDNFIVSRYRHH